MRRFLYRFRARLDEYFDTMPVIGFVVLILVCLALYALLLTTAARSGSTVPK